VDLLEQESATSSDFPFSLLGLPRFLLPRVRALSGLILVAARSELLLFTAVHKFILSMLSFSLEDFTVIGIILEPPDEKIRVFSIPCRTFVVISRTHPQGVRWNMSDVLTCFLVQFRFTEVSYVALLAPFQAFAVIQISKPVLITDSFSIDMWP
jgi:hypothetical protein